jgi:hypothetical protein
MIGMHLTQVSSERNSFFTEVLYVVVVVIVLHWQ